MTAYMTLSFCTVTEMHHVYVNEMNKTLQISIFEADKTLETLLEKQNPLKYDTVAERSSPHKGTETSNP